MPPALEPPTAPVPRLERLGRRLAMALVTLTYFTNQRARMDDPHHLAEHLPIGSGVVEAACKTLVKQRRCGAGMRWKRQGAKIVLSLRALAQSPGRWAQFWHHPSSG